MEEKQAAVDAAQKAYDEAKKASDNAEAQIAKGSFGFFEEMGAAGSAGCILNNAPLKEYTEQGNEEDATSLENMKAALEWIKECNELRENHQWLQT